jgi:hypothetical protein
MKIKAFIIIVTLSLIFIGSCADNFPSKPTPEPVNTTSEPTDPATEPSVHMSESTDQAVYSSVPTSDSPDKTDNPSITKKLELSSSSHLTYIVTGDTVAIIGYIGEDEKVIIPAEIEGKGVSEIGEGAFNGCKLTSVEIPNSVTSFGNSAFSDCSNLSSLTIPDSVTSIGYLAFSGCSSLTAITIPNSMTNISNAAFLGCSSLQSIKIPGSVKQINSATFAACTGLASVTISEGVMYIVDDAFERCASLTSITIPASIEIIAPGAFLECLNLAAINVVEDNSFYASLDGVLYNKDKTELISCPCGKKGAHTIPYSVITIRDWAFSGCAGLTFLTIPCSVTSIGYEAFGAVINLAGEEVVGPSSKSLTVLCPSGSYALEYCEENSIKYKLSQS